MLVAAIIRLYTMCQAIMQSAIIRIMRNVYLGCTG